MQTRDKILISSALVSLLYFIMTVLNVDYELWQLYKSFWIPLLLGLITIPLVAWSVNFNLRGERLFNVLVFPSLSIGLLGAFFEVIVRTAANQLDQITTLIILSVIFYVATYVLVATVNVLNLASIENIPLGQAGRAAHYILTMIFSYFSFALIISYDLNILIKVGLAFLLTFIYTFIAQWTISLAYSQRMITAIGIAFLISAGYLTLALWPIDSFYFALVLTLIYYMSLGLALEIREILNNVIVWEYIAIFIAVFFLLISTAVWGVNGAIL